MPPYDSSKKPLAIDFNEERLRAWKEKRAKIASVSRQERARLADAERTDREKFQQAEKEERLKEAAELRAAQDAEHKAERLNAARIRLAGRADVDAARARLQNYRRKENQRLLRNLFAFVFIPTVLVAAYQLFVATPLYEARSQFAIASQVSAQNQSNGFLAQPAGYQDAAQLRAHILSPQMMAAVDTETGFFDQMGSSDVDPFSRLTAIPALQITDLDQYRRAIQVKINSQEAIVTLSTRGRTPQQAENYAKVVLANAAGYLAAHGTSVPERQSTLYMISDPTASEIAAYPRRLPSISLAFMGFATLFAMVSIFGTTLRRHSQV